MKRTNTLLALLFLAMIFSMAGYTALHFQDLRLALTGDWQARESQEGDTLLTKLEFAAHRTESHVNALLDERHTFIQLYGAVQRATGQRFVEDSYSYSVIRLSDGSLTFGSVDQQIKDVTPNARAAIALARELEGAGVPFTAAIAPQKVSPQANLTHLPAALRDFHNEEADQFLSLLEQAGIHTLDLREGMEVELGHDFFCTDHHWTAHGAFRGNVALTRALSAAYGFPLFEEGLEEESFTVEVYEDLFLGSQGKRVGTLYAGVDHFPVYYPNFPTHMTYRVADTAPPREGTMDEALYFSEYLVRDYFNGNPYVTFAGGDWGKATVTNHRNPDGPRVVMIRDSFGCALTPFLALQCSELITIDPRAYGGEDLAGEIAALDPDLTLLFYSVSSTSSDIMFEF